MRKTVSNAIKTKAVKYVQHLVKNEDYSITRARKIAGTNFGVNPNTLYIWERDLKSPKRTAKTTVTTSVKDNGTVTHTQTHEYSFNEMANDIRGIMRSLVHQDGRYTTKEAGVIGKLYGTEIQRAKLQLEVHKHNTKVSSSTVDKNILSLS